MWARLFAFGAWLLLIVAVSQATGQRVSPLQSAKPHHAEKPRAAKPRPLPRPAPAVATIAAPAKLALADAKYEELRAAHKEAILAALNKTISIDAEHAEVSAIIDTLRTKLGIPIVCDEEAIPETSHPAATITLNLKDVSGRAVLALALEPRNLDWAIRDEVLWIAPREKIAQRLETRVYDITDIVAPAADDMEGDPSSLVETITSDIMPSSWTETGGAGSIQAMNVGSTSAPVVAQSYPAHRDIAALLVRLREARSKARFVAKPAAAADSKCTAPAQNSTPPAPRAVSADADSGGVVNGNNQFACDLFALHRFDGNNVVFSPLSLTTAMGMLYAGARGQTASEIAHAMHFTRDGDKLHPALAALNNKLLAAKKGESAPRFAIANRLWVQQGYPFSEGYLRLTREQYGADAATADFLHRADDARSQINRWVSENTHGKIPALLESGSLNALTRMVAVNAIYFKGKWKSPFGKGSTRPEKFHGLPGTGPANVEMMFDQGRYKYAKADGVQILEKPYMGTSLAMTILLPEKGAEPFAALRSGLAADKLAGWLAKLTEREVKLYLPRFEMGSELGADDIKALGIVRAFDESKADFSGMHRAGEHAEPLWLGLLSHAALIDVDEEGTEAAAATAVGASGGFERTPPPAATFHADHPFVFIIRDSDTGCILFLGQFMSPPVMYAGGGMARGPFTTPASPEPRKIPPGGGKF